MSAAPLRVLFVGTGNAARSIMAESLLSAAGPGFRAHSAGCRPTGRVNQYTLRTLAAANLPGSGLRSKSWDEFTGPDAPRMDVVVSLCPLPPAPAWPGTPRLLRWDLPDPVARIGGEEPTLAYFAMVFERLAEHIRDFCKDPANTRPGDQS